MPSLKNRLKNIRGVSDLYYLLQAKYRRCLSWRRKKNARKTYEQYRGSGFTCNFCGAKYLKFVPDHPLPENAEALKDHHVVAGYGDNIFCPSCFSNARERLVRAVMENEMNICGKNILHFAPEKYIYEFLKSRAEVQTADLFPGYYRSVDKNIQQQNITALTFRDSCFDMVIGNHILEHIPDDVKALKEIARVLKPGGCAILQVPFSETLPKTLETPCINDPVMQSKLYGQKDHVRIYTLKDYCDRVASAGLTSEIIPAASLKKYLNFAVQPGECFISIRKPLRL